MKTQVGPPLRSLTVFDLFYSNSYSENLSLKHSQPLPSNATGRSGPPQLAESLERERKQINQVGDEAGGIWKAASQSWILPAFFQKEEERGPKDGWRRKEAPALDTGCPVHQTPVQDKRMCPFPSKIVFKIQPSTFKNLSLISNSNKRTAWWLLFCFLLPNSSLRLHNKSV